MYDDAAKMSVIFLSENKITLDKFEIKYILFLSGKPFLGWYVRLYIYLCLLLYWNVKYFVLQENCKLVRRKSIRENRKYTDAHCYFVINHHNIQLKVNFISEMHSVSRWYKW